MIYFIIKEDINKQNGGKVLYDCLADYIGDISKYPFLNKDEYKFNIAQALQHTDKVIVTNDLDCIESTLTSMEDKEYYEETYVHFLAPISRSEFDKLRDDKPWLQFWGENLMDKLSDL